MIDASVLIVGGGAIGGVTAGRMAGHVREVVVLDANAEHVARLGDPGLRLDILGEERTVPLHAVTDATQLPRRFDFALVTLKAPYLEPALGPLVERDAAETYVSLGNGLVQDRVAGLVGPDRLLAGVVEWGSTNLGPGALAQTTHGPFVVGELDGSESERVRRLTEVLGTVEDARVTRNIRGMVWSKLLVNSTWSGLGVVSGTLYRDIAAHPSGRRVAVGLWREGLAVGRAQDLALEETLGAEPQALEGDGEQVDRAIDVMMAQAGATKASMLQDVERRIPCEVDVINGAVVARGREHRVRTPLNEGVVELVHAMERGEGRPSPDNYAALEARLAGSAPG
jgi:2-dehydropantoate 2-reductase